MPLALSSTEGLGRAASTTRCTYIPGHEHWTEVFAQSWIVLQTALLVILVVGFCVALSPPRGDPTARRSTAARKRVLATRSDTN